MKTFIQLAFNTFVIAAFLVGCSYQHPNESQVAVPEDAACVITNDSFQHIFQRHCRPDQGSRLLDEYCSPEGMQTLCEMIQNAENKSRVVQSDKRVRYDANLDQVIGQDGEKCGRLIITSVDNGNVITEFPEFGGGAPEPCSDDQSVANLKRDKENKKRT